MKEISIVVPVYNSQDILFSLQEEIEKALNSYNYELILVHDCGPDNSWDIITKLAKNNSNIVGVNVRKNYGQDNAIMAGLNLSNGDYVVIMDDDLQHSPFDIPKLLKKCKEGYDVCYANFESKKQSAWKNAGSWLNGKIAEYIIDKPKNIYLSPFELIKRDLVLEIIKYKGPYPYVQGLILNYTTNVTQINIEHHKRHTGVGNFNLIRSIRDFLKLATSFSVVPLRVATIIGFISAISGFMLIPFYMYQYIRGAHIVDGWTSLMVLFLLIGNLILISLGIIGEYLGRMYLNINNKPQYAVSEILNGKSK
jgi:polyisoprenyl-phosphate glycosyltransferase